MKFMQFSKKEIGYSFLITSGFYILFFFLFPEELRHMHSKAIPIALDIISINLAVLISWRLNSIFSNHFDKHYRWEERPFIRLVTQIVITSLIAFGVTIVCMIPNALITNYLYPDLMDALSDHNVLFERITYYFIAIMVLFQSIFIGGNFYKRWIETSLEAQKLKYENVHAQLHVMQNQSQPHFLFNTLNTLTSLIEEDQKTAIEFVQQLSNFYRYLLQREEHHLVRLDEELHFVNSYIFLQKKRFGENLKIEINVDHECEKKKLPIFVLLILFENAVKHNIVSSEIPLCIKVFCEKEYLVVQNNLQRKVSIPPSNGYGLANIRNRYHILSANDIVVEEADKLFTVKIPLLKETEKYEGINN
jgi:two-component system, LytTR family, sensor kinase